LISGLELRKIDCVFMRMKKKQSLQLVKKHCHNPQATTQRHGTEYRKHYQNMTYHLHTIAYYQGRRQCIETLKNMILTT